MQDTILVLDAMGVIYRTGAAVDDLLIPFIQDHGGTRDKDAINRIYTQASLGKISRTKFWSEVGLNIGLEDDHLARYQLSDGVLEFLAVAKDHFTEIVCLSNDVGGWSKKLRTRMGVGVLIDRWIISGDVGHRKPSSEIYQILLQQSDIAPDKFLFVDDRTINLDAAAELGMRTVLFDLAEGENPATTVKLDGNSAKISGDHPVCFGFADLLRYHQSNLR